MNYNGGRDCITRKGREPPLKKNIYICLGCPKKMAKVAPKLILLKILTICTVKLIDIHYNCGRDCMTPE